MPPHPPHDSPDSSVDAVFARDVQDGTRGKREYMMMTAAAKGQVARMAFIHAQDKTILDHPRVMEQTLTAACANGHAPALLWLLARGGNASYGSGKLLKAAIAANSGATVDALLRGGLDLRAAEGAQFSSGGALAHAVLNRKPEAAKALLLHGCDPYRSIDGGPTIYARMRDLGMQVLVELSNRIWLRDVPAVPPDFARRESLPRLQGTWPDHKNLTGFQLAAYHGQIDSLLARLTAQGRRLTRSDLIGATPKHPQTVLFICGQRGELGRIFTPALWGNDVAAMRAALSYVPAAFRAQIDTDRLHALERRQRLAARAQNAKPGLRIGKK